MLKRAAPPAQRGIVDFYYHVGEGQGSRHRHEHDGHQISITVGGTADMLWWTATRGEARLAPRDGHILVNPAGESHSSEWRGSWDCVGFHLDRAYTAGIARDLGVSGEIAPVYDGSDRALHGLARGLLEELDADALACRLYAESLANFLALRLLKGVGPRRAPGTPALTRAQLGRVTEYIIANIDKNLASAELAAVVDLSAFHFSRRFKAGTGMTPYRYVMRQRIALAQELLSSTRLPITEISYRTGFSSHSHMGARFREIVGVTPHRYRERG